MGRNLRLQSPLGIGLCKVSYLPSKEKKPQKTVYKVGSYVNLGLQEEKGMLSHG